MESLSQLLTYLGSHVQSHFYLSTPSQVYINLIWLSSESLAYSFWF